MLSTIKWFFFAFSVFYVLPALASLALHFSSGSHSLSWAAARRDSSAQAPDPRATPEAVIQVYAGRAFRWRGALGVHTWIAVKPQAAERFTRYEVFGWGVRRGRPAVLIGSDIAPDGYWFGSRPELLFELRGEPGDGGRVEDAIARIDEVARRYRHNHEYTLWPGPNSNSFIAHVAREVPELQLDLPPTAIGKDYLAGGALFGKAPSGTGFQLSLLGLFGILLAADEGVEVNLLGLTFGVDLLRPALKLPGFGRVGLRP